VGGFGVVLWEEINAAYCVIGRWQWEIVSVHELRAKAGNSAGVPRNDSGKYVTGSRLNGWGQATVKTTRL
jgi:hypothetical protein